MGLYLGMLPEGTRARVIKVYGGRGLTRRLAELGFNIGELVKVVRNHHSGPVLIEVKDSRIALGRGVALKIIVEEVK
ncbi:ferrous iron transport protein A [Candidatus Bathyarchaeota archaeon]|nr:ferrous iron transport protein A [Candidatus Bathyarchaeota archaeon]